MRIHYIQNDEVATPGFLEDWVREKNYTLSKTKMYENEVLPDMEEIDLIVILGGRMGAYEEEKYPWLIVEKEFIRDAISNQKWVLGICLGAQLLADVLGGRVYPHTHKEIGWWPLEVTNEGKVSPFFTEIPSFFTAFQYHGDTFDLPVGAIRLATNRGCTNQAFSYNDRVLALQFHPEFTEGIISQLESDFRRHQPTGEFIQSPKGWGNELKHQEGAKSVLFQILEVFEEEILKHPHEVK